MVIVIPVLAPLDLLATGLNGGPFAGFRNLVHNGDFSVNQRKHASGVALAASAFGHDRWKAGTGGCTYTFSANEAGATITITAGTLRQVVDMAGRLGGTYVLSWSGSAQGRLNSGAYQASPILIGGTTGVNFTIEFGTGTLYGVKVEPGTIPTPFETRWPLERAICQRYFWRWGSDESDNYEFLGSMAARSNALGVITRSLPFGMRSKYPSLSFTGPLIALDISWAVTITGAHAHADGSLFLFTSGAFAAGQSWPVYANNTTAARILLSADL